MNDKDFNFMFVWWIITAAVFFGAVAWIANSVYKMTLRLERCEELLRHSQARLGFLTDARVEQQNAINAIMTSVKSLQENNVKDRLS